ncbi:MAG: hypothetical protein JWQ72_1833 [Polaromonas sp.]|nr:hypothetical protein [Polaromonas sp.]
MNPVVTLTLAFVRLRAPQQITLARLSAKHAADDRQLLPAWTAATARPRRSGDKGLAIPAGRLVKNTAEAPGR